MVLTLIASTLLAAPMCTIAIYIMHCTQYQLHTNQLYTIQDAESVSILHTQAT